MSNLKYYTLFLFCVIHSFSDLGMWLWSGLGWLTLPRFITKANTISYFGIFKFSMLTPYNGCGKRALYYHMVFRQDLTIIPFSSALSHLPLSLPATNRQAPSLRATQSDWLSLWVRSALPCWLVFPLTDPRKNTRMLLGRECGKPFYSRRDWL